MARYTEPTPEQEKGWNDWVAERPGHVRKVAEKFNPWTLYWMESSKHRVTVAGFDETTEGVTVRINVLGEFNLVTMERQVFGIKPEDLTECDLPAAGDPVGAMLTNEQARDRIDDMRLSIAPDRWEKGLDGLVKLKGMPDRSVVKAAIDEVDDLDLPDGAHWQMLHERLGLDQGDLFEILAAHPDYFGLEEAEQVEHDDSEDDFAA